MTQEVKRRRGTTAQHAGFTGALAEITIDTDKSTVVVHDGSTAGGHPLAKESALPSNARLLPVPVGGDAGKVPVVNGAEDGYDLEEISGEAEGISFNNTAADLPGAPDNVQAAIDAVADELDDKLDTAGAKLDGDATAQGVLRTNIGAASSDSVLNFYGSLSLEMAEDRLAGPVTAGPDGNGLFDGFNVLTYVDVGGAVNLDTSAIGLLKNEIEELVANGPHTLTNNIASWNGFTLRNRFEASVIAHSGGKVRLRLTGPSTGAALQIGALYIGHAATSGHPYSFDGTQVPVTVGGASSFTVGVAADVMTDWIDYDLDASKPLVTSYYVTAGDVRFKAGTSAAYATYYKAGNDAAATVAEGSYTESGSYDLGTVSRVDVSAGDSPDLLVESQDLNLAEVPEWCRLIVFLRTGGAGINSDILFSATRDGSDYDAIIMGDAYPRLDGSVVVVGQIDMSELDSGTTGRWRVETQNGANVEILAVGVMFGVDQ